MHTVRVHFIKAVFVLPLIAQAFAGTTQLPKSLEEQKLIGRMAVGQRGYTVPWAMMADKDGTLYLNSEYTFDDQPFGTSQMLIIRTQEGYTVDVTGCKDYRWIKGLRYLGKHDHLPVTRLITP